MAVIHIDRPHYQRHPAGRTGQTTRPTSQLVGPAIVAIAVVMVVGLAFAAVQLRIQLSTHQNESETIRKELNNERNRTELLRITLAKQTSPSAVFEGAYRLGMVRPERSVTVAPATVRIGTP